MTRVDLTTALVIATRTIRRLRAERDAATAMAREELDKRLEAEHIVADAIQSEAHARLELLQAQTATGAARAELSRLRAQLLTTQRELSGLRLGRQEIDTEPNGNELRPPPIERITIVNNRIVATPDDQTAQLVIRNSTFGMSPGTPTPGSPQNPQPHPQAEIAQTPAPEPETEDGTAIRFSLLEPHDRDP